MTMHLIVCPHCGKQMKTRVLVKGTIRCPGCQVRFKAPEPHQGIAATIQDEAAHDKGQIIAFTGIGFLFVFSFFATGALRAFHQLWTNPGDATPMIFVPFYIAQMFLALYFFMPLMYWLFGKESKPKSNPSLKHTPVSLAGYSQTGLPYQVNHRKGMMGTLGILGLIFTIIGLVFFAAIGLFFFAIFGGF